MEVPGNWFLPHLNFRYASVEQNIIHDFRCIVSSFFCVHFCASSWVVKLLKHTANTCKMCMACDRMMHQMQYSKCDWIDVSHNNLCNQFYCLRRRSYSYFLFLFDFCDSQSLPPHFYPAKSHLYAWYIDFTVR